MANINGTPGADILNGTGGGVIDTINGGAGNDVIQSVNAPLDDTAAWAADAAAPGAGDVLNGGDGNDTIVGSAGAMISGGAGNDVLDGLAGSRLDGGAGNDTLGGDVAVYTGNQANYVVTPSLTYIGQGLWAPVVEVKDIRPGSPDGTDMVFSNTIQFADGVYTAPVAPDSDALFLAASHEEVYTPETPADGSVPGTPTAVLDANALLAFGVTAASFAIAGGADASAFTIDPVTGQLSFVTPPDFEAPTDAASITQGTGLSPSVAGDNVYEVVLRVVDANGVADLVGVLVHVDDVFGELAATIDGEVVNGTAENDLIDDGGMLGVTLNGFGGDDTLTTHSAATVDGGAGVDTVEFIRDAVSNLTLNEAGGVVSVSDGSQLTQVEALSYTGSIGADVFNASSVSTLDLDLNGNEGNDQLTAGAGNDILVGGAGSDVLVGGAGNDKLYASLIPAPGAPNEPVPGELDTLTGGAGNDLIVGDGGSTVVRYAGNRLNYTLTLDPLTGVVTVQDTVGTEGTDTVSAFAVLQFADQSLDANLNVIGGTNVAPVIDSNGGGAAAALTVNENTLAVTTVHATDANGQAVTYSINGGADAARFQINAATGALSFKAAPNAEAATDVGANNVYDVIVQASDGTLTDTQAIAVTVANVNEFAVTAPTDVDAGVNHVASGSAAGTLVGVTARATDADFGTTVAYSIVGFNAASSAFKIDAATGVVSVNNPTAITLPAGGTQSITVQATSSDGSVSTQVFSIAIDKVNAAPVIDSNGGGATAAVTVNENTTAVTTVHATDPNGDAQTYSIVGGADAARFQINAATGALSFKAAPNAEAATDVGANNVYDVTVQATDGTLTDTQAIAVTVANVNEFAVTAPTDVDAGVNHVASGSAAGTLVGVTARATDADFGTTVAYSIVGFNAASSAFKIDAATGVVSVNNPAAITLPAGGTQSITVQAASSDGSVSTQVFSIAIDKVNAAPVIDSNGGGATAAVTVNENTTAVTTVHATDPNGDAQTYSIVGGADAARFQINAATGALSFKAAPNAEAATDVGANNVYDVTVQATDGTLTDTQAIAVTVANVNEFAVTASTDVDAGVNHVASGSAAGTLVGVTARATDADFGTTVTYSIVGFNAASSAFKIDAATGVVSVNNPTAITLPAGGTQSITVQATSSDGSTSTQAFSIAIDAINVAPVITSLGGGATGVVSTAENSNVTLQVTATDANPGQMLSYSISGGADAAKFAINASTGVLSWAGGVAPDFENPTDAGANNVYDVQVKVADPLGLSDTQAIAVTVTNVVGQTINGSGLLPNILNGGGEEDTIKGGLLIDFLYGQGGNDTLIGGGSGDTLNGGDGKDTVSYATAGSGVSGDLSLGLGGGLLNDSSGDLYFSIENLTGSNYNDTLIGNSGVNVLNGGAGNDTLRGNGAADTLIGGAGNDTFDFNALSDSGPTAMDNIVDFVSGSDKIDLRDIDASSGQWLDQAFSFLGTGAFSGSQGQLRYEVVQGHTYVYGDVNGDKVADFQIDLTGSLTLKATDFYL